MGPVDDKTKSKSEDAATAAEKKTATEDETKKDDSGAKKSSPSTPQLPPVDAAARRLERLLGGTTAGGTQTTASKSVSSNSVVEAVLHSNPSKIVKRWLGTSSGTAGKATLQDLAVSAKRLLNPTGDCATGRDLVMNLAPPSSSSTGGGDDKMDIDTTTEEKKADEEGDDKAGAMKELGYLVAAEREVESWLLSLAVRLLWREKRYVDAFDLAEKGVRLLTVHLETAARSATHASSSSSNTFGSGRGGAASLFPLLARMHRYQSLTAESLDNRDEVVAGMRSGMVKAHRMACLRRDVDTQATLLNLLLRDLLTASQVEQAQKLLSNSTFPDSASNNQLCRYLYHSGRIQALRLEYTSAFSNLSQCLRKAPTNTGLGFRIAAQRLLVVVQLLMGEIPDRNVFFTEGMIVELDPYMKITQAVRRGDLAVFHETVSQFASRLREDGTYTLISRLAHSVVKAGLRRLNVSYSRISLADVATRLGLPNATSAEFVVAKAVRDGVIDATINHESGYVQSHDLVDVYATTEPAEAFHRRIAYCLTTHNDAVRGMRYPPDAYKKQLEASRGMKGKDEDDDKTDEEKAQELEDELDEEY